MITSRNALALALIVGAGLAAGTPARAASPKKEASELLFVSLLTQHTQQPTTGGVHAAKTTGVNHAVTTGGTISASRYKHHTYLPLPQRQQLLAEQRQLTLSELKTLRVLGQELARHQISPAAYRSAVQSSYLAYLTASKAITDQLLGRTPGTPTR